MGNHRSKTENVKQFSFVSIQIINLKSDQIFGFTEKLLLMV
jgi:hypothetical protein